MPANQKPNYQDFDPPLEWTTQQDGSRLLTLYLPGFSKERLHVQVSSTRKLRISGDRPHRRDNKYWQRFHKEFQIPSNCDLHKIAANYKAGILYVRLPLPEDRNPPKTHSSPENQEIPTHSLTTSTETQPHPPPPQRWKETITRKKLVWAAIFLAPLLVILYTSESP